MKPHPCPVDPCSPLSGRCLYCGRLVVQEWAVHRGLWVHDPTADERILLRALFPDQADAELFSRLGLPGADHVCDRSYSSTRVLSIFGIYPRGWVKVGLILTMVGGLGFGLDPIARAARAREKECGEGEGRAS